MRWFIMVILILLSSACTTVEVKFESTSTPDLEAISALANLMLEGTQYAQILAERGPTPEPVKRNPTLGQISGKVCYPGTSTPSLIAYFRNTTTGDLIDLEIAEFQSDYSVELSPGEYFVYAWSPQYLVGGLYSQKVICDDNSTCDDHNPILIPLEAGAMVDGINLCDWGLPASSLPLPPGTMLPGVDILTPPRE